MLPPPRDWGHTRTIPSSRPVFDLSPALRACQQPQAQAHPQPQSHTQPHAQSQGESSPAPQPKPSFLLDIKAEPFLPRSHPKAQNPTSPYPSTSKPKPKQASTKPKPRKPPTAEEAKGNELSRQGTLVAQLSKVVDTLQARLESYSTAGARSNQPDEAMRQLVATTRAELATAELELEKERKVFARIKAELIALRPKKRAREDDKGEGERPGKVMAKAPMDPKPRSEVSEVSSDTPAKEETPSRQTETKRSSADQARLRVDTANTASRAIDAFNETSRLHIELLRYQSWLAAAPPGHAVEEFYKSVADEVAELKAGLVGAGKLALKVAEALAEEVVGAEAGMETSSAKATSVVAKGVKEANVVANGVSRPNGVNGEKEG